MLITTQRFALRAILLLPPTRPILIIAESARALAASARNARFVVDTLDYFADMDTRRYARYSILATRTLIVSATEIITNTAQRYAGIVLGSGFEKHPDAISTLGQCARLYANTEKTIKACNDPQQFFPLLDQLGLKHPAVYFSVQRGNGLLRKTAGESGGKHVKSYVPGSGLANNQYLQEKKTGIPISIVFIANGKQIRIVGINYLVALADTGDYRFQGAVTVPCIHPQLREHLKEAATQLTRKLSLYGLCGIDAVLDNKKALWILEVNPRPPATFQLHENYASLFQAHLAAFSGELLRPRQQQRRRPAVIQAMGIVYAKRNGMAPQWLWPNWTADQPAANTLIPAHAPICSLYATGHSTRHALRLLRHRYQQLAAIATPGSRDGRVAAFALDQTAMLARV